MLFPAATLTGQPPCDPDAGLTLLRRCRTLREADQAHARLVTSGLLRDPSLAAEAVLCLCSSPHASLRRLAHRISFSSSAIPDYTFAWNALIKCSSHGGDPAQAVLTFSLMLSRGVLPDGFSFSLALKACSRIASLEEGLQIHALLLKCGLASHIILQNSLVRFYCRCGLVRVARNLFDGMSPRDSVSWNSMIDGYAKIGMMGPARELFDLMGGSERNLVSWNSMICGYARLRSIDGIGAARGLFDQMPARDLVSWNSMIDGYMKCGRLGEAADLFEQIPEKDVIAWASMIFGYMEGGRVDLARRLFDDMPDRDVITWNVMMSGYVKNGYYVEALQLFQEMHTKGNLAPDSTTLATTLSAIAESGRVHDGISIHDYIERKMLPLTGKLGVALINMYSKCGWLEKALQVFEISGWRSVDHWNAMIGGLAIHGFGHLALRLFGEMERLSLRPDDITFIGVLNACSHAGLVREGLTCFEIMRRDYNLKPKVQHYGCVVDILGRAGRLEEARRLIEGMPVEPTDVVWRALLSSCKNHDNFYIGQSVAKHMIEMGSCSSSSYVLLSNIYAGVGLWDYVGKVRMMMKEQDIRKITGCSWIELDGSVHEFVVGDKSHPQAKEIYSLLDKMCAFRFCNSESLSKDVILKTS